MPWSSRPNRAIALLRAELDGVGNDAAWIRKVEEREGLLPEVVRQQCLRWKGAAA